jgi:hypothetical protein
MAGPTAPTKAELTAAQAVLARAASAKPLDEAMAELCVSAEFTAGLDKLRATFALYPGEPSNDLHYAVMSMDRLVARYQRG